MACFLRLFVGDDVSVKSRDIGTVSENKEICSYRCLDVDRKLAMALDIVIAVSG